MADFSFLEHKNDDTRKEPKHRSDDTKDCANIQRTFSIGTEIGSQGYLMSSNERSEIRCSIHTSDFHISLSLTKLRIVRMDIRIIMIPNDHKHPLAMEVQLVTRTTIHIGIAKRAMARLTPRAKSMGVSKRGNKLVSPHTTQTSVPCTQLEGC